MDIYLAARIVGEVRQINIGALESYLNSSRATDFSYMKECQAVIDFAKSLRETNSMREAEKMTAPNNN